LYFWSLSQAVGPRMSKFSVENYATLKTQFRLRYLLLNFYGCSPALVETFHSPGGIHYFFISGVERMAVTANFHFYLRHRGTNQKNRSAGAGGFRIQIIFGMYLFFHDSFRLAHFSKKAN